jgi:predicted ATP-dependent endonuclease of OLD family
LNLSRIKIKNYRSIKELDLKLSKGKNIIVGKNNSGKTNIIKAIDLILGENSPTFNKSENITENDFYKGDTSDPIYIFCELIRDNEEELNYQEINKCFGYYFHAYIESWENKKPIKKPQRHDISENNFWDDIDAVFNIDHEDESVNEDNKRIIDKEYVNPKLINQQPFRKQLDEMYSFGFIFKAFKEISGNEKISKEIRFIYREDEKSKWILGFSAPIRNELLQSAIIQSFREPSNELRINSWSWYGKLLRNYINTNDINLQTVFKDLKSTSNDLFKTLNEQVLNSNVKIAFPNTEVSFQFNPDTKIDIYKSALIYVNDGFNSVLSDKGAGIQSTIIIGLFHYYTRNIAHSNSSLLAIEEPELFLHPQARRVISNRLDDFLENNKNQVIVTTHASEFITTTKDTLNIIVVQKDKESGTQARNAKFSNSKDRQILLRSQNSEMFFADKVLLVEGGEKYILESIALEFGSENNLGENWLNDFNCSIISVGGKDEFWKYRKILNELNIPNFILGDFDFFLKKLSEFGTKLNWKEETKVELNTLKSKLENTNGVKRLKDLADKHDDVKKFLSKLKKEERIFILENELEDNYKDICNSLLSGINLGKEEKPIYIVGNLISDKNKISDLVNCQEYKDFLQLVINAT